ASRCCSAWPGWASCWPGWFTGWFGCCRDEIPRSSVGQALLPGRPDRSAWPTRRGRSEAHPTTLKPVPPHAGKAFVFPSTPGCENHPMKRLLLLLLCGSAALLPAQARAQVERFEVGQRLRAFEAVWEEQTDPKARKRAIAPLQRSATAF